METEFREGCRVGLIIQREKVRPSCTPRKGCKPHTEKPPEGRRAHSLKLHTRNTIRTQRIQEKTPTDRAFSPAPLSM
jgi:hypothetical protein